MRFVLRVMLLVMLSSSSPLFAQHRSEYLGVREGMRRLDHDLAELEAVINRDATIASEVLNAITVVQDEQEHNATEKAMAHARRARKLIEEGPPDPHLREIVDEAIEIIENRREWIHSVYFHNLLEEYHHRVIHPLALAIAEDLEILSRLESEGLTLSEDLLETRVELRRLERKLLDVSDVQYE